MAKQQNKGPALTMKKLTKKSATDAMSRLSDLEKVVGELASSQARLAEGVQKAFEQQGQQFGAALSKVTDLVEALSNLAGRDAVNEEVSAIQKKRLEDAAEQAKVALNDLLEKNMVAPSTTINKSSIVVGREYDKDGNLQHPGRVQLQWSYIQPQFQEKLKGTGPGTKIEAGNGNTFEVTEVYDIVPQVETVVDKTAAV